MTLDLNSFIAFITTLMQTVASVSGLVQQYSVTIIEKLPPSTVLWLTLATATTVGYGIASLGAKVCKILAVVFWAVFFLFLAKELLHI